MDNFDAAIEELRKRGIEFLTQPTEVQGNRLIFFSDGDGNYRAPDSPPPASALNRIFHAGFQ